MKSQTYIYKRKRANKHVYKDARDTRVPQLQRNFGVSPKFSLGIVSQPSLETKKNLVFQLYREEGESRINLELISQGLNS